MNAYVVFVLIALCSALSFFAGAGSEERKHLKEWQQAVDERSKLEGEYKEKGRQHDDAVKELTNQRDSARKELEAATTGRRCLEPRAVRVLNNTGRVPSDPKRPADAPSAAEGSGDERQVESEVFATDRDVSGSLLECRTEYGKVYDQLNKIIDIELSRTK